MATPEEIKAAESALINAHNAGDEEAAKQIANFLASAQTTADTEQQSDSGFKSDVASQTLGTVGGAILGNKARSTVTNMVPGMESLQEGDSMQRYLDSQIKARGVKGTVPVEKFASKMGMPGDTITTSQIQGAIDRIPGQPSVRNVKTTPSGGRIFEKPVPAQAPVNMSDIVEKPAAGRRAATSGPVVGAISGYNAQDAANRYLQGDTTGAAISGVGAAAPLAPKLKGKAALIGPAVGLAAQGVNILRDKFKAEGGSVVPPHVEHMRKGGHVAHMRKGGHTTDELFEKYVRGNVGVKSQARRDREAQFVHDIVPTHLFGAPKQIGIQEMQKEGAVLVPVAGDRTLTGHKLRAVNNVPLRKEVELEGGPLYGQKELEQGRPGFWASNDGTAQGFQNMLARGADRYGDRPFYGLYGAMDYDAGNFAKHNTRALYEQIEAMNPSRSQIKAFDAHMRQQYPNWVGVKDEESLNQLLGSVPMRKFFAETLNKPTKATEFGMPSGEATMHAITEPELRDVPVGNMGFSVGRLDPRANAMDVPTYNETYNRKIPGEAVGQMKAQLHWSDYFPDAHKQIMSNPRQAPSAWGTFKMGDYYQPVTQELVDKIAPIEEAIEKHGKIITPGQAGWFKEGGSTSMDYRSKLPRGGMFPWSKEATLKADLTPRERAEQNMRKDMLRMGRGMDQWKEMPMGDKAAAVGDAVAKYGPEAAEMAASFHPAFGLGYAGGAAYDYLRNGGDLGSTAIDVATGAPGVLGALGKLGKKALPYGRTMAKAAAEKAAPYVDSVAGLGALGAPAAIADGSPRQMSQGMGNIDDAYLNPVLADHMDRMMSPVDMPRFAAGGKAAKALFGAIKGGMDDVAEAAYRPHGALPGDPYPQPSGSWMRDYQPGYEVDAAGLPATREGWDILGEQTRQAQNRALYELGRTGPNQPSGIQYMGKYRRGTPEERAAQRQSDNDTIRMLMKMRGME